MNFEDWYKGLPVITRSYMTACFLTTLAVYLDFVNPLGLYLNFTLVFKNLEVGTPFRDLKILGLEIGDQLLFLRLFFPKFLIPHVFFVSFRKLI